MRLCWSCQALDTLDNCVPIALHGDDLCMVIVSSLLTTLPLTAIVLRMNWLSGIVSCVLSLCSRMRTCTFAGLYKLPLCYGPVRCTTLHNCDWLSGDF